MQDPRRRPAPPFAGVDLRRPKGYPARPAEEPASASAQAPPPPAGDPCPRCESRDTKFCYYNNYNTSQPRHFCKSCRRYWTKGGSLRNVPVGGGTRKSSSSSSSSASSSLPAAASAKRSKNSKRRRVAPAPDPVPGTDASAATATTGVANNAPAPAPSTADKQPTATEPAATEKPTAPEPTATTAATDERLTAPPSVVGCFTSDTSAAPGLGLADVGCGGGKELPPEPNHFEWPSGCDLASYWNTGVFADTDPALFLNLP